MPRAFSLLVAVSLAAAFAIRAPLDAQVRPIYDLGAAGLTRLLERLQTTASALHIGAHPDDEDSAFIARTARGNAARVAYLSLNRGEGGQNIIGTELFDALGVIRTEELLQARRLDGGEQFFTRTFDYGFSKTRTEAAAKWNEREVLGDMVRVIRMYRPLVIYSRWQGTPADGHGQHQLAGYLAPLAFKAAADPNEFPEQLKEGLRPWQTKKLYRGVGFRPDPANPPTTIVQTGLFDPVLGRTFAEIAAEGRSQHKSQEMGTIEMKGPQASGMQLVESVVRTTPTETSVFAGLDISLRGMEMLVGLPQGTILDELTGIQSRAEQALNEYDPQDPYSITAPLVAGLRFTRAARARLRSASVTEAARADADFLLSFTEQGFEEALAMAAGVIVNPLANDETVTPAGSVGVNVRTFVARDVGVMVTNTRLTAPPGWSVTTETRTAGADQSQMARVEMPAHSTLYRVTVPADAPLTQPYFLARPRQGDKYDWQDTAPWLKGLPFDPPVLTAHVSMAINGVDVSVSRPVQYRFADRVRGELRRDVQVVPLVAVGLDSRLLIVPLGSTPNEQRVVVRASSFSSQPVTGTLQLRLPQGWTSTPTSAPFTLKARGDRTSASFVVTAPARRTVGAYDVTAEARVSGATFARDVQVVSYPHIQTHRLYWPATATAQVVDLTVAPVRIGYVMGSGDQVPDALRRIGMDVTLINDEMLTTGDLSQFDTIVVGIRASEARPEFVANNGRLLQYVERGGTMIVQYQQGDYVMRGLPPYPASAPVNARVTDETAPVKVLAPEHPALTFPNRITAADFNGWVQERNLYSWVSMDPRYTPLLESADPGEPPVRGGEVYADVGKGRYVYTSYAWFRQLPAGVPGAYRQFVNLVSLSKAPTR